MENFLNVLVAGILLGGIYSLASIGLNLIFGVVRIVNFAQGELIMLAMYATAALYIGIGLDPYLSVVVVVPALFLLGVLLQRLILQPLQGESMMQIFATFGVLMIFQNLVTALTRGENVSIDTAHGATVIQLGTVNVSLVRLIVLVAVTLIAVGLNIWLRRSLAGKAIRAVAQDRQAARLMGIDVERTFMLAFGIGAALAGLAGALLTPIYTLSPQIGGNFILAAFAVVVLGGLGSVTGAFIGGFIVGIVESFAGFYIDPVLKQAIWFLIFIIVLIVRPQGLLGQAGAEEVGLREQR
jgi:branched-chain amino acid transport system permease protein